MKYFSVIFLSLLLLNCNNNTKIKKGTPINQTKTEKKEVVKKDTVKEKEPEFPFLTDKTAMEFFLEYEKHNKENKVRIKTDFGDIDIELFNETKFHRANFIYLTKRKYFDNTQFYRVINNFIVQGGSTDDPDIMNKRAGIGKYLLPPDTKRGFKHDRGVISMPSSEIENAYKLASPYEFFIVQQDGGAHHLDGSYTIFGKVINGMDVVDEIAKQKTDDSDWPVHNIYIKSVRIID